MHAQPSSGRRKDVHGGQHDHRLLTQGRIDSSQVIGLLLALGIGLLIGLERERRKGDGPDRRAAGIRSFALVAVSGALVQLLSEPGLVAVGGLLVVLLGTACGAALALLLYTRARLHRFATQVLGAPGVGGFDALR